jgi:hypothetical protein
MQTFPLPPGAVLADWNEGLAIALFLSLALSHAANAQVGD